MLESQTSTRPGRLAIRCFLMFFFASQVVSCGDWGAWREPLYRGLDPVTGLHDYYGGSLRAQSAFCKCKVKFDGTAGWVATTARDQYVALHKMSKPGFASLLLTDEAKAATDITGYTESGVVGYIAKNPFEGSVALSHLFNAKSGDHLYTVDPAEQSRAITDGYNNKGIVGYVWPNSSDNLTITCREPCPR